MIIPAEIIRKNYAFYFPVFTQFALNLIGTKELQYDS